MSVDPRDRVHDLVERGLEGAHEHQVDYSHLTSQIRWLRIALAALAIALGLVVYFVATTANSADDRSQGTVRYLEGKQGRPGIPGEGGKPGANGLRGPGPTRRQLDAALRRACHGSCNGKRGKRGAAGGRGRRGRPPSFREMLRAARAVCAGGACRGEDGRPPSAREIIGAVVLYCQVKGCKGDPGRDGRDGRDGLPPGSWTFVTADGQAQRCVDSDRDGDAVCEVVPAAEPPAGPPVEPVPPA